MNDRLHHQNAISPAKPRASAEPLPDAWIEKIFGRLEVRYGSMFHDRWRGCNLDNVKAGWAEELAGFRNNPDAIGYALKSLDASQYPPTLPEFLAACRAAPAKPAGPAIGFKPAPANPERSQELARSVAEAMLRDPLGWAMKPQSRGAYGLVTEGAKRDPRLAQIVAQHVADGVADVSGRLLKRWDGLAWVAV